MATELSPAKRRLGRPLPATDPDALKQAYRLTTMAEIGALLRAERASRELSQADMAARLGISRQTLVGLEAGAEGTAAGTLLRILTDLGIVLIALPAQAATDPHTALGLWAPSA
jgi:DNA-binding XRE family transcriptional regulator